MAAELYLPPKPPAIIRPHALLSSPASARGIEYAFGPAPVFGPAVHHGARAVVFCGATTKTDNATSYTLTDHNIGPAHHSRVVVVIAAVRDDDTASPVIGNPTVAGVTPAVISGGASTANNSKLFYLRKKTGSTATIFFDTGGITTERAAIAVYALYNFRQWTPTHSAAISGNNGPWTDVPIPAGGVMFAGAIRNNTGDFTSTGLTVTDDTPVVETARFICGRVLNNTDEQILASGQFHTSTQHQGALAVFH